MLGVQEVRWYQELWIKIGTQTFKKQPWSYINDGFGALVSGKQVAHKNFILTASSL